MARPSKPVSVIKQEKKAHRTNKELISRERSEKAMMSGDKIGKFPEVRENRKASMEFDRVVEILESIDKNDKMYETVINRYCLMLAECIEMQKLRKEVEKSIKDMKKMFKENILSEADSGQKADLSLKFADKMCKLSNTLIKYDAEIEKKRSMLLAIEKESGMTMAAMLRTIPKQPEQQKNPLLEVLGG